MLLSLQSGSLAGFFRLNSPHARLDSIGYFSPDFTLGSELDDLLNFSMERVDTAIQKLVKADREAECSDPKKIEAMTQIASVMRELNFKPPCECDRCLRQYRTLDQQDLIPYVYLGHVKDAASIAAKYIDSIESDRNFLLQKISDSGVVILREWYAGVDNRKILLAKARPDLYPNPNPLIDIPSHVEQLRHQRQHRMGYMLPYLNVDNLSRDPRKFIGLLHHRTHCLPEAWVPFDHAMLWSGWKQCTLTEKSADGCIIMFGEQFGRWSTFDPIAVHRNDACGAPRALMILESQQILMEFLRDLTAIILEGVKPSKSRVPANITSKNSATSSTTYRESMSSTDWMQLSKTYQKKAYQKKDQPWLSYGEMFSNQPYSAAPTFDIDTMIEIAENQANEAQDELWLLQTDLEYFHDRSTHHEATWFDKVGGGSRHQFTAKQKLDNIGFIMTIKVVLGARDWRWLLEECQNVKRELQMSGSEIGPGKPLPQGYESALGSLESMLLRSLGYHQINLKRVLLRSPAFSKVFKVTGIAQEQNLGTAMIVDLRDYSTLHRDDRIGWCLFQLTANFADRLVFEPSAILQYLDDFLETCPRKEAERIDQEIQRCISELAAITGMMKLLDLHRPSFRNLGSDILRETRGAWQVLNKMTQDPVIMLSRDLGLGSSINPLSQFCMPTGRRDEKWLVRRDTAHLALKNVWTTARDAYQKMSKAQGIPQDLIDPQLEWMMEYESIENVARLENERRMLLDRLKAAKERAAARKAVPSKEDIKSFGGQQETDAKFQVSKVPKTKTKTRPVDAPELDDTSEEKGAAAEETSPILYRLKPGSDEARMVRLMFPDLSEDVTKDKSTVDWINFVRAMTAFGFRVEHRGGSSFTFKGEIMMPNSTLAPQKRSFNVHRPHPDTEMGPILLQSLGRRCNRRFGWQRGNFAVEEKSVERGV